jgi:hypothetical protein
MNGATSTDRKSNDTPTTFSPAPSTPASSEKEQLEQLLLVSTTIFRQALSLVDDSLKEDGDLIYNSQYLPGSTIGALLRRNASESGKPTHWSLGSLTGKHLRHARDYFMALLDGAEAPAPHIFSYDTRKRNTPMERELSAARDAMKEVIARLERIVPITGLNETLTLNAITPFPQTMQTTFGREVRV